jgi:hypothetical protein
MLSPKLLIFAVLVLVAFAQEWRDSDTLTRIWTACSMHDSKALAQIFDADEDAAFAR